MSQINAVEAPNINSPYDETTHHLHIEAAKKPEKRPSRRLASYFFRARERAARVRKAKGQYSLLDNVSKGEEYLLDLANLIRKRLKDWRARDYAGATMVTRELLGLWRSAARSQRLFFAQLETVKTVLFPVEGRDDLKQRVNVPSDEAGEDAKAGRDGAGRTIMPVHGRLRFEGRQFRISIMAINCFRASDVFETSPSHLADALRRNRPFSIIPKA